MTSNNVCRYTKRGLLTNSLDPKCRIVCIIFAILNEWKYFIGHRIAFSSQNPSEQKYFFSTKIIRICLGFCRCGLSSCFAHHFLKLEELLDFSYSFEANAFSKGMNGGFCIMTTVWVGKALSDSVKNTNLVHLFLKSTFVT